MIFVINGKYYLNDIGSLLSLMLCQLTLYCLVLLKVVQKVILKREKVQKVSENLLVIFANIINGDMLLVVGCWQM